VRTLEGLQDPAARTAFLATLRGVVDVHGQRVSAVSRLSSAAGVPTLLVWGDRDPIIPMSHGQQAHDALPNSRLVVFPGAGHEPHRFDPVRFAALLTDELPVRTRAERPRRGTRVREVHESAR
jgi:pimeloyl-ACP methyl ester carboxylesterase